MASGNVVHVRWNSCHPIPVAFQSHWSVRDLKEEFARSQGVNPEGIRIIFQGQTLADDISIQVFTDG